MSKSSQQFPIPNLEDLTGFFKESFGRDLSTQEQKIMDFFGHQVGKAVLENIGSHRLKLCATMILMLSLPERREYCLRTEFFGNDEKRNVLAKTIEAIFLENTTALDAIIRQSNDELAQRVGGSFIATAQDKFFAEIGECRAEEKSAMKEFCTNYTISLAKNIFSVFSKEESEMWRSGGLPIPHELLNHPQDRLEMLGHAGGVVQGVEGAPRQAISNPQGYSLRSRGEKRAAEVTL